MTNQIVTAEQERNVIENLRHDLRLLHWHPWIDGAGRKSALRRYIRGAIARVRSYRAAQKGVR